MTRASGNLASDWSGSSEPRTRCCDQPGCERLGEFRAPRSREKLGTPPEYFWFCLEHVRSYNAAWNYYAGMSETEIERHVRDDTVWQRPSWPLGWRIAGRRLNDPLNLFGTDDADTVHNPELRRASRPLSDEEKALAIFELEPPFELALLKSRYKLLVKRHHPDAHGGDKAAEERLKIIIQAYTLLKARYFA